MASSRASKVNDDIEFHKEDGVRQKSTYWVHHSHDGGEFAYVRNGSERYNRRYLKCAVQLCSGRASVHTESNLGHVSAPHSPHCHPETKRLLQTARAQTGALEAARKTPGRLTEQLAIEAERNAGNVHLGTSVRRKIRRTKAQCLPPAPRDICEYVTASSADDYFFKNLTNGEEGDIAFFRESFIGDEEEGAYTIYATDKLIEGLKAADEVMVDATYAMTPLLFTQLFIIHFLYMDKPLRGIYVYMTKKTTKAYLRVFEAVERITGGLHLESKILMMDWEDALRSCIRQLYPGVRIYGCWFHYAQALYHKLCDLGLRNEHKTNQVIGTLFAMTVSLLLLPSDTMADAFHIIELCWTALDDSAYGGVADGCKAKFGKFLEYVKGQWLENARRPLDEISLADAKTRSNNAVESFHATSRPLVQARQPIFKHLEQISSLILKDHNAYKAYLGGHENPKQQKVKYLLHHKCIKKWTLAVAEADRTYKETRTVESFRNRMTTLRSFLSRAKKLVGKLAGSTDIGVPILNGEGPYIDQLMLNAAFQEMAVRAAHNFKQSINYRSEDLGRLVSAVHHENIALQDYTRSVESTSQATQHQVHALQSLILCKRCQAHPRCMAMRPCGHMSLCESCWGDHMGETAQIAGYTTSNEVIWIHCCFDCREWGVEAQKTSWS